MSFASRVLHLKNLWLSKSFRRARLTEGGRGKGEGGTRGDGEEKNKRRYAKKIRELNGRERERERFSPSKSKERLMRH